MTEQEFDNKVKQQADDGARKYAEALDAAFKKISEDIESSNEQLTRIFYNGKAFRKELVKKLSEAYPYLKIKGKDWVMCEEMMFLVPSFTEISWTKRKPSIFQRIFKRKNNNVK